MLVPETLTNHTEDQAPNGSHCAFLNKLERDQKARRANAHRRHLSWFIFDFAWETIDEQALAQDLACSEHLYLEEVQHYGVAGSAS
jgi:hypothetical protein